MADKLSEEQLAQLKSTELQILKAFDELCKTHGLTYFITAGTLLGAVRHKGFIPWDDDIDVIMPKKDYKKLAGVCKKSLPDGLFLQNSRTDKGYPFHFSKLCKLGTEVYFPFLKGVEMNKGIHIDIFPADKCPSNKKIAGFLFKWMSAVTYALIAKQDADFDFDYTKKSARLLYKILRILPRVMVVALRDFVISFVGLFCSGRILATVSGGHGYPKETYNAEWFTDKVMLTFEDGEFPAPKGYDKLLTNMYGDYMTPPSEDDRNGHFYNTEQEKID